MPIEVTVDFEGHASVIAFDVMPSFEQLMYCLRHDIVRRGGFEVHSWTLRGTPVLLKDQHALNRVSSDGSNFAVTVQRVASPTGKQQKGGSSGRAASPTKNRHASAVFGASPAGGTAGLTSPLSSAAHSSPASAAADTYVVPAGAYEGIPSTGLESRQGSSSRSPLRNSRMFAPVSASPWGTAGSAMASNLARVASSSQFPHPSTFGSSADLGATLASDWTGSATDDPRRDDFDAQDDGHDEEALLESSAHRRREGSALNRSPSETHSVSHHPHHIEPEELRRALDAPTLEKRGAAAHQSGANPENAADIVAARFVDVIPVNEVITAADVVLGGSTVWHSDGSHAAIIVRDARSGDMCARITTTSVASTMRTHCSAILAVGADAVWTGFTDGTVIVFQAETFKEVAVLRGHRGLVTSLCVSSSGTFVFSASEDGTVRQYDAAFAALHNVLQARNGREDDAVLAVAAVDVPVRRSSTPFQTWLFTGTSSRAILLWTADHSEVTVEICDAHEGALRALATEPFLVSRAQRVRLWSGSNDGRIRVWDAAEDKRSAQPAMTFVTEFVAHEAPVVALKCLEGRMLSLSDDHTLCVFALTGTRGSAEMGGDQAAAAGDDGIDVPSMLTRVENGSRASPYTCLVLGWTTMLRSVWCCGGLDRTVSVWEVADVPMLLGGQQPLVHGHHGARENGPAEISSDSRHMRLRMCQRVLTDCVAEEFQARYVLHVEHERDLFRLLSLSDTLLRANHSVTIDVYAHDLTAVALLSHAQLGVTYLSLYDGLLAGMCATMQMLRDATRTGDENTSRLMSSVRALQADLEAQIQNLTLVNEHQRDSYHSLRAAHEAALARVDMLEADVTDLQANNDALHQELSKLHRNAQDADGHLAEQQRQAERDREALRRLQDDEARLEGIIAKHVAHAQMLEDELQAARRNERDAKLEASSVAQRLSIMEARNQSRDASIAEEEAQWVARLDDERRRCADVSRNAEQEIRLVKEHCRQQVERTREEMQALEVKIREQQHVVENVASISTSQQRQRAVQEAQWVASTEAWEQQLNEAKSGWKQEVDMVEAALQERTLQCHQLRLRVEPLEAALESAKNVQAKLQAQVNAAGEEKALLEARLQRATLDNQRSAQQQVPSLIGTLKNDVASLEDAVSQERTQRQHLEQLLAAAEEHYETVRRQSQEDVAGLKATVESEKGKLQRTTKDMQAKLDALTAAHAQLQTHVRQVEGQLQDAQDAAHRVHDLQRDRDRLSLELEGAQLRVKEVERDLQQHLVQWQSTQGATEASAAATVQTLKDQLAAKSEALAASEGKKRAAEASVERLQLSLTDVRTAKETLEADLDHANETLHALRDASEKRSAEAAATLRSVRDDHRRTEQASSKRLAELEAALRTALEERDALTQTIATLREETTLNESLRVADAHALQVQRHGFDQLAAKHERYVMDSESERNQLRLALQGETTAKAQLQDALDAHTSSIATKEQTWRSRAELLVADLKASIAAEQARAAAAEEQTATLHEQLASRNAALHAADAAATSMTAEAQRAAEDIAHLKATLATTSTELYHARLALADSTSATERIRGESQRSSSELDDLRRKIEEVQEREHKRIQTLESTSLATRDSLQQRIRSLEDELHRTRDQLQTAQSAATASESLSHRCVQLEAKVSELEIDHAALCASHKEELALAQEQARAAQLEADRERDDNARSMELLQEAQVALTRAASPPSPSSAGSTPTLADRKAVVASLRLLVLVQQQRDALLHSIGSMYIPYMEARTALVAESFAAVARIAAVQAGSARAQSNAREATLHELSQQNASLVESSEQRKQLITEVQEEMRLLYARYKSEVDAHRKTRHLMVTAAERGGPELERLRTTVALYERELSLRDDADLATQLPVRSQSHPGHSSQRESICELLEGVRDAVDLLQPISLAHGATYPSDATLVALYEWLVSAQLRCEALALALSQ